MIAGGARGAGRPWAGAGASRKEHLAMSLHSTHPAGLARLSGLVYGGDYNPEQWPEEVWLEDARLMREAGVNLVSVAIFAWARLEPSPGQYDFAWLDRVLDLLHAHGVAVNLGTATPAPPPWLAKLHPESLPVTAEGVRLWHGSRRHYCPSSTAYREHAVRLVTRLAEHYRGHPALALWHIDNEYACHFDACYCDACAEAFRAWLQARHGTLDALNAAWGTAFWGQIYRDWDELIPPRSAPTFIHPGHQLDWRRFCSDAWLACFEDQRSILRRVTPDIPVTTNFMGLHKSLDYWRWAAREDVVANDSYPDPSQPEARLEAAMHGDLMRSLGRGRPWLLMEQTTSLVNWRAQNVTRAPGVMRLYSYQALARGAEGVMFFQWRASLAGGEQFHGAMLPHAGTESRVWREVVALGGELRGLSELLGSRVQAQAAILLDWPSWWGLEIESKPTHDLRLLGLLLDAYRPLFAGNITVDFARPDADLGGYRLVLAPNLYLVDDAAVANLESYVRGGGTLLLGCFSGVVDRHGRVRAGGEAVSWRKLLGLRVEEYAPFAEGAAGLIEGPGGRRFGCHTLAEVVELAGAEALAVFRSGFYAGRPALTRQRLGPGAAYYLATCLDAPGMGWLAELLCREAGLQAPQAAPPGVELVRRSDGARSWLFALNHADTPASLTLGAGQRDLLGNPVGAGALTLPPFGVAILAES
jgi:beta-galactosidase